MHDVPGIRSRICSTIQRTAPLANALMLLAWVVWVLGFESARRGVAELESLAGLHWRQLGTERLGACLGIATIFGTFVVVWLGLWFGRRESRSIRAWLVAMLLVGGWLAAWLGRHDLIWYGHALRVSSEVAAANELAQDLDANWPTGDGDYPGLGVVLGYPKPNPVSLILAGEPVPVGALRVVAIEKSRDGETFRFQLAHPNHDTWIVRSKGGEGLTEFVNGFGSRYQATRVRELSADWWLIRYASNASP